MLSPSMHFGNRLEIRRPTYPSRSPLPTRSTSIHKLNDSHHFHYEYVELGPVNVELATGESELLNETNFNPTTFLWNFIVESNNRKWMIHRTFSEFIEFDCQLHRCVFDRRHSRLIELRQLSLATPSIPSPTTPTSSTIMIGSANDSPPSPTCSSSASTNATTTTAALSWAVNSPIKIRCHLATYVDRLSQLTGSIITCFPVLKFLELDSRGNHFVPIEQSQINTPAMAAAIVIQDFTATQQNELSIKIGDIVSVIEMKNMEQSDHVFWKGKLTICKDVESNVRGSRSSLPVIEESIPKSHHFAMGYFPSSCVKLFKAETDGYSPPFARSFRTRSFMNRKAVWGMRPRILKQSFWTTPRNSKAVFGIDLTLHLIQSNTEVPLVLTKCIAVIESHGLITGIYRQCGIQSNIARLRYEFDHGNLPDLTDSKILRDIHCVSSLLKTYFRQLPNPLFTYELYADILAAYESDPKDRIKNIKQTIRRLPPAHYRTARALMYHLSRMCRHKDMTDMNASNLSIVWAPNLFRVPTTDEDAHGQLLRGITIHKSLCNFFIVYAHVIFCLDENETKGSGTVADDEVAAEMNNYMKHKEDVFRNNHESFVQPYFHVNGGPANLPTFHTVIDRPLNKEDLPKWKKLFRYSSLENTISGFFNKRRSAKSSVATQHTLTDVPMNTSISSEGGNMRRSSSMFSSVTKNMEEIGQNMIRHVRNLSLRRSRRGRDRNPLFDTEMYASGESTSIRTEDFGKPFKSTPCDDEVRRNGLRVTHSIEGNTLFNETESHGSKPIVIDNNNLLILSNPELKNNPEIPDKIIDAKQKRVMFESSSRAEQIFYAVDDHTDENFDEADKYSTDISSAESLPLDISRYDNVVPQNK